MAPGSHAQTRTRSLADIVRAMFALDLTEPEQRQRAYALFEVRLAPLRAGAPPLVHGGRDPADKDLDIGDANDPRPSRPDSTPRVPEPEPRDPAAAIEGFDLKRATPKRLGDQPATDVPPERGDTGPAELVIPETQARERLFEKLPKASEPPLVPLLDPRRSNNILRELCSVFQRSNTIDVMRVVSLASRGLPMPARLPYKIVRRPARRIAVAYDGTDRMATFLDDADAVMGQISRVTNARVTDLPWEIIEDTIDRDDRGDRGGGIPLHNGTHVLFLSDLGFGDWARKEEWRLPTPHRLARLATEMEQLGVTMSALLPVPPSRWEAKLPTGMAGLYWDRGSTPAAARHAVERGRRSRASRFGGVQQSTFRPIPDHAQFMIAHNPLEGQPIAPLAEADRVALTAMFCARVTPKRLRALRLAMLPRSSPEAEAQAWHGEHFIRYPSHIAMIDQRSLDEIRDRAIRWTPLMRLIGAYVPEIFRIWPDLISTPDESTDSQVLWPRDWGRARHALAQVLGYPRFARFVTLRCPVEWRSELHALATGRGCVIVEEARYWARTNVPSHVMEPFEEELLWDQYLDERSGEPVRVALKLARLEQALTNELHKDEYHQVGLDFVRHRLPRQSAVVQRNSQAQRLAMLARQLLGFDIGLLPGREEPASTERTAAGGVELTESRQEQRDLYVWSPRPGTWRFRLEYGPGRQLPGDALPVRIRVPALARITLALIGDDGHTEDLDIAPGEGHERTWSGPLTIGTFQGARYPISGSRLSDDADRRFWLGHARRARVAGDWSAATRWSRRAGEHAPRTAAGFHLAKAAAISEESVDEALERLFDTEVLTTDGRARVSLWRSVLAAYFRMLLLEVDAKLQEAISVGRSALNLLSAHNSIAAVAYRLRIGAVIVQLLRRGMQGREALPTARTMVRDLRTADAHRRFRVVRLAMAEAYAALFFTAIEDGRTKRAADIARRAMTLARPGDEEVSMIAGLTAARHASHYAPAARALALYDQALEIARRSGRFDWYLTDATDYCRILYNSARIPAAAEVASSILDRALTRRSWRRSSSAFHERAYQSKFRGGGIEQADAEAATRTTPTEDRRALYRNETVSPHWFEKYARELGLDGERLARLWAEEARRNGLLFTEMLAYDDLYKTVGVDQAEGRKGLSPPPSPLEARFNYLAQVNGDTLGAANAFQQLARIEFPRWTGKWHMSERLNPNELYQRAIDICERLEVPASVLLFRHRWADELIAAEEPDRALEVVEEAIRYGEGKKNLDREFGLARATRGNILYLLGRVEDAREELLATVQEALKAEAIEPLLEARAHLARIAADEAEWGSALEHLEFIERVASSPMRPIYELPRTENYTSLIGDIVDGRALNRADEMIARKEAQENPEVAEASDQPRARARNFRLRGLREREKAQRRAVWRTFTSRAGYLLRCAMTEGGRARPAEGVPFNDYWYWGNALVGTGSAEAIWFLEMALEVARAGGTVPESQRKIVEDLLAKALSFEAEAAGV